MIKRDDCTPEEVALVEERIAQAFAFLKAVLDNPAIVQLAPSGSEMRFQELVTGEATFHLIAFRPESAFDEPWVARIIEPAEYASEHRSVARSEDVLGSGGNLLTRPEVGDTAEEALEALAVKLRNARPRNWESAVTGRRTA